MSLLWCTALNRHPDVHRQKVSWSNMTLLKKIRNSNVRCAGLSEIPKLKGSLSEIRPICLYVYLFIVLQSLCCYSSVCLKHQRRPVVTCAIFRCFWEYPLFLNISLTQIWNPLSLPHLLLILMIWMRWAIHGMERISLLLLLRILLILQHLPPPTLHIPWTPNVWWTFPWLPNPVMKINYSVSERRKIKTKQKPNQKKYLDKQSLQLLHMVDFCF